MRSTLFALTLLLAACGGDSTGPSALALGGYTVLLDGASYSRGTVRIALFINSVTADNVVGTWQLPTSGRSGPIGLGFWNVDAYVLYIDDATYAVRLKPNNTCEANFRPGPGAEFWGCTVTTHP